MKHDLRNFLPNGVDFAFLDGMHHFEYLLRDVLNTEKYSRKNSIVAFPDGQSCLNLAAARLRYIAGTAWSAKCYMNMRPLYQPQVQQTEAVA